MSLQSSQFKTKMEKPTLPSCYESWGLGPFPVQIIDHHTILLKDGTRIAMKLFIPVADVKQMKDFANVDAERIDTFFTGISAETEEIRGVSKFPAILEYIPYRKSDKTACRDIRRHPVMASHGYVVARADVRGTGESTGLYFDEYTEQEQEDGCEIIGEHLVPVAMCTTCRIVDVVFRSLEVVFLVDWLASREWSNGRVGVYGKSWGGFNGLQLAFRRPTGLKAVISLYSTGMIVAPRRMSLSLGQYWGNENGIYSCITFEFKSRSLSMYICR